ncbi:aa3-type cytochrome oxidase subunit CtaJ [Blastococcus sp. SYSU D01042]
MTVAETILVFAGVPLAVVLVLALLTIGPGVRNRRPRYKPGQPWDHEPIWYEPHPEGPAHGDGHGETAAIGSSVYGERHGADAAATHAVSGGTSADGSAAHTGGASTAPRPQPAGPLGGARGTW